MRNYVIINGTNSNTINGLGINELPPISKPPLRVQTEEIDGRDGDIITPLGYGAYNKTITIGLFGTGYDIDNIVSFFNGEGTIVFSNEPDKYYNYKIIEQIDYEALQKFKQASITFHCQPFKYPLSETPKEIEPNIKTLSNVEIANITDSGISTIGIDLKGNTSQSGTPTPTSPIPVSVVSGDNEVVVCGKNIIDLSNPMFTDMILRPTGIVDGWSGVSDVSQYINVLPNTQYSLSINTNDSNSRRIAFYKKPLTSEAEDNTRFISYSEYSGDSATFTTPNECNYIRIAYYNELNTIQLEKGTATSYEPYTSQTYEVDLPVGLELCKIGTYQDYFTKNSDGQWCKYNAIGKVVLDGTQASSGLYNGSTNTSRNIFEALPYNCRVYVDNILSKCNLFPYNNMWSKDEEGYFFDDNSKRIIVRISKATLGGTTQTDWDNWLSSHNLICYYALETPYLSLIEDNNLIEQLDNIQNATSYEGTTNISQVNNDKAFLMDVDYLEQGTDEITINNIGNTYAKPTIALEGNGVGNIYLNDTQIFRVELTDKMTISTSSMEAYDPDTSALLNRQVVGNYNSMTLQPGNNTIRIDGIDKATITDYTRWL